MKIKILLSVLVLSLIFGCTACSGGSSESEPEPYSTGTEQSEDAEETAAESTLGQTSAAETEAETTANYEEIEVMIEYMSVEE
ncbi:MAG: hypothetical protein LUF33_03855 [Clostridiales bacterium]|nr:hypothetical protein [Clostridiales bacterium]